MNKIAFYSVFLIFFLSAALLFRAETLYNDLDAEAKALKVSNDSLQSELFMNQTMLDRYALTLDMLKCDDSIAGAKFEKILYTETE